MVNKTFRLLFVAMQPVLFAGALQSCLVLPSATQTQSKHEFFARRSVNLWQRFYQHGRDLTVLSPDSVKTIVAKRKKDGEMEVYILVKGEKIPTDIGSQVNCEVAWAPDSKAFSVTYSDGGLVGTYYTDIYNLEGSVLRKVGVRAEVEKDYWNWIKHITCTWPDGPNVVVIKWLENSRRLLVAAQIPTHTVCDSFGTFKAYELLLPEGKIMKRHVQIETKRLFWNDLGFELRGANDECIRNPKSCEVPRVHPEDDPAPL